MAHLLEGRAWLASEEAGLTNKGSCLPYLTHSTDIHKGRADIGSMYVAKSILSSQSLLCAEASTAGFQLHLVVCSCFMSHGRHYRAQVSASTHAYTGSLMHPLDHAESQSRDCLCIGSSQCTSQQQRRLSEQMT